MTTRKKKESFVVFEDWMRYARCFNDAEFRQFMINILNYYKGIEPILNTPNLQEVWNDVIDDLSINVNKKQQQKERGSNLKETNPKLNPKLRAILNTMPGTEPDTELSTIPNTIPSTSGMGDGRCETGDDKMNDEQIVDSKTNNDKWKPLEQPVIHKGDTKRYNDFIKEDFERFEQEQIRVRNTSSIPGVFKPPHSLVDEMFS